MRKIVAVLAALLILTGCSVASSRSTPQVENSCAQLSAAKQIIEDTRATMAEQYDEAYFDTDDWKIFVSSYWEGFWSQHKYCKICQANGDVP